MTAAVDHETYDALINDMDLWDMRMVAGQLGVQYQTVKTWRKDADWPNPPTTPARARPQNRPKLGAHPNVLPPPDMILSRKPIWFAGTIRFWAMQTDRMNPQGQAHRRKPPGRPRAVVAKAA